MGRGKAVIGQNRLHSLSAALRKPFPSYFAVHLSNTKLSRPLARLSEYKAHLQLYRFEASKHSGTQRCSLRHQTSSKRRMKINANRISTL